MLERGEAVHLQAHHEIVAADSAEYLVLEQFKKVDEVTALVFRPRRLGADLSPMMTFSTFLHNSHERKRCVKLQIHLPPLTLIKCGHQYGKIFGISAKLAKLNCN